MWDFFGSKAINERHKEPQTDINREFSTGASRTVSGNVRIHVPEHTKKYVEYFKYFSRTIYRVFINLI